ncbi:hypothetical protein GCM10010266_68280 [Streptomyces griseomycini]|nr:hypothetical protein GCM10010266_68280 [Streptomyces griseomycini]
MLVYPSGIDVSSSAPRFLSAKLREHRRDLGTRWRRLSPGRQALLALAHLRNGHPYAQLAAGLGIGTATACRYTTEAVELLAAPAPLLVEAARTASTQASVLPDGTLLPIGRIAAHRPFCSGKHRKHGMNVQVLADPSGRLPWASPTLPGAVHDVRAAREHAVVAALADAGITAGRTKLIEAPGTRSGFRTGDAGRLSPQARRPSTVPTRRSGPSSSRPSPSSSPGDSSARSAAPPPASPASSKPSSPAFGQLRLRMENAHWLDCSRMHPLTAEMPEAVHLPSRVGSHLELRAAIDLLAGELDEMRPGSCVALPSLLDLLLVYIIRAWMTEAPSGAWPRVLGDPVAAAALRALHSDPAAPWSNDRLAAEAGVSRPTLARRFTTLVGRPPMAYLTWWRVIRAAALLRDTPDTRATIAGRVGYGSPYALSHAFQREFGTTPGRYRAQAAKRSADVETD